jgi:hypothetical protein
MGGEIDRRPLLKAIATSVGATAALGILPKSWTRPVVQSVVVPAHAATSPPATTTTSAPRTSGPPTTLVPTTTAA